MPQAALSEEDEGAMTPHHHVLLPKVTKVQSSVTLNKYSEIMGKGEMLIMSKNNV